MEPSKQLYAFDRAHTVVDHPITWHLVVAHLHAKVPRPGDSEGTIRFGPLGQAATC